MRFRKDRRAFTIVELVIVIAVIAILAAVLIPTFASVIENAEIPMLNKKRQMLIKSIWRKIFNMKIYRPNLFMKLNRVKWLL